MTERATEFLITLAQLNPTVGDVEGNAAKARAARERAKADGADLFVLSELFIAGYQPEDLVLKPAFQTACRSAIEALARETADGGPAMLIGVPWVEEGKLYNACALLDGGRIAALRFKANLPNYGVFDEKRLFARGPTAGPVAIRGVRVGVPICEDVWVEESEDYENVVECQAATGAGKLNDGLGQAAHSRRFGVAIAAPEQCGGQQGQQGHHEIGAGEGHWCEQITAPGGQRGAGNRGDDTAGHYHRDRAAFGCGFDGVGRRQAVVLGKGLEHAD